MNADFLFLDEVAPFIRWDAKYATWDNFTGRPVDGYRVNRIVASRAMCAGLLRARARAATAGFGLLVWDAYRPQRAVDCFLRWAAHPDDGRTKSRHYPRIERPDLIELGYVAPRSGHTRGAAVDLTMFDLASGELLPMGGDHDLMDVTSHHEAPGPSREARTSRQLLRAVMEASGFEPFHHEWWHYSLRREPHPDTYFDFPIAAPMSELVLSG